MNVEFYDAKRKRKLIERLNSQFGITSIPNILFETGKEKIRGFSGDLTIDEIYDLDKIANVEFIGLSLFRQDTEYIRLGFDCALLLKKQIGHHVVSIDGAQFDKWITGNNLEIVTEKGIYVIKYGEDVFGCGISNGKNIINFVPKERRIRRSS